MKALYLICGTVAALMLAGCGGGGGQYTGTFNSPQAGGLMRLVQQGTTVTGTYPAGGHLEGTVEGNRLLFRWWQGKGAENGYDSAAKKARGDGYFLMDADGGGFDGKYRRDGDTDWADAWYGIRERE